MRYDDFLSYFPLHNGPYLVRNLIDSGFPICGNLKNFTTNLRPCGKKDCVNKVVNIYEISRLAAVTVDFENFVVKRELNKFSYHTVFMYGPWSIDIAKAQSNSFHAER